MTFEEFDALLAEARTEVEALYRSEPGDRAIQSVRLQLAALHEWTRGGRCPAQAEKDRLNFGLIASRELDTIPVAEKLYTLASHVNWWGERRDPRR